MIRNFYQCPTCKTQWDSTWHGAVSEECHNCGEREILPAHSEELEEPMEENEFFKAHKNENGTWHVNAFRSAKGGKVSEATLVRGLSEKVALKIVEHGNQFISALRGALEETKEGDVLEMSMKLALSPEKPKRKFKFPWTK